MPTLWHQNILLRSEAEQDLLEWYEEHEGECVCGRDEWEAELVEDMRYSTVVLRCPCGEIVEIDVASDR